MISDNRGQDAEEDDNNLGLFLLSAKTLGKFQVRIE